MAERDHVIAVRHVELHTKMLQIVHRAQLAVLRRARFGRSSEKLDWKIELLEGRRCGCTRTDPNTTVIT
jgi:hypothetical protein